MKKASNTASTSPASVAKNPEILSVEPGKISEGVLLLIGEIVNHCQLSNLESVKERLNAARLKHPEKMQDIISGALSLIVLDNESYDQETSKGVLALINSVLEVMIPVDTKAEEAKATTKAREIISNSFLQSITSLITKDGATYPDLNKFFRATEQFHWMDLNEKFMANVLVSALQSKNIDEEKIATFFSQKKIIECALALSLDGGDNKLEYLLKYIDTLPTKDEIIFGVCKKLGEPKEEAALNKFLTLVDKKTLTEVLVLALQSKDIDEEKIATLLSSSAEKEEIITNALILSLDRDDCNLECLLKYVDTLSTKDKIILDVHEKLEGSKKEAALNKFLTICQKLGSDARRDRHNTIVGALAYWTGQEDQYLDLGKTLSKSKALLTRQYSSEEDRNHYAPVVAAQALILNIKEGQSDIIKGLVESTSKIKSSDAKKQGDGINILAIMLCTAFGTKDFDLEKRENLVKEVCGLEEFNSIFKMAAGYLEHNNQIDLINTMAASRLCAVFEAASEIEDLAPDRKKILVERRENLVKQVYSFKNRDTIFGVAKEYLNLHGRTDLINELDAATSKITPTSPSAKAPASPSAQTLRKALVAAKVLT